MMLAHKEHLIWGFIFQLLLVAVFLLYRPALTGSFHFDDPPNLMGLAQINDLSSAWQYVVSGDAGPLGRPLALLSFLLNRYSWPTAPEDFLYVNVLIHLLNGVLLCGLVYSFALKSRLKITAAPWFALLVAGLWMIHPFLASTSLLVVQRMTSLMTSFVLMGLILYVYGRSLLRQDYYKGLTIMILGIGGCTLLASLCKENGALLPFYALVLDLTILPNETVSQKILTRIWKFVFLVLPQIIIVSYVILKWPQILAGYHSKSFSLGQRLLTETRVLWEMLYLLLIPHRAGLGPMHDDYLISTNLWMPISTLFAVIAWPFVVIYAWLIRERFPILLFAVLWYLAGHVLESTVFALDIYFEHRNYLPAMGPILLLVYLVWQVPHQHLKITFIAASFYGCLLGFILFQTTSLWGQPALAAELWLMEHPKSERAAQYLSQQYFLQGDQQTARDVLRRAAELQPENLGLAMQVLQLSCGMAEYAELKAILNRYWPRLNQGRFSNSALDALEKMINFHHEQPSRAFTYEDILQIIEGVLSNPKFSAQPNALSVLHLMKARMMESREPPELVLNELDQAFKARPSLSLLQMMVTNLVSLHQFEKAKAYLDSAMQYASKGVFTRKIWLDEIAKLRKIADMAESYLTMPTSLL